MVWKLRKEELEQLQNEIVKKAEELLTDKKKREFFNLSEEEIRREIENLKK